ncbi:Protein-disulfide isomerase [Halapricum desulfuricans]|uniref:Protein-disulfide isomerase n=1 Tax=Halapricum desulfuricans TaxID=2841257 RepID=A0A897NFG5_9EURY|nr:thioredoxin domain-containing protein [Halapricum desulfuricans]QSG11452.1 Protein-disulfide isomerase [Halapricum desulfuricans]
MTERTSTTRRGFLVSGAVAGSVGLAGCGALSRGGTKTTVDPDAETLPAPVRGDSNADVTVMAFEDYVCGHCATFVLDHLPDLISEYVEPGTVRYEHHDFPLPLSDESWRAPNAARAVQDTVGEDAFWEFSHGLYENQSDLGPSLYETLAEEVGADPETVRSAAVDETYETTVVADRQYGDSLGVDSTPTVFVNGNALGRYDFETVSQAVDDAL